MSKQTKKKIKRLIFIVIGAFIMAIGSYFFLFAANIASGGVGGLALIIHNVFPNLPIGAVTTIFNIALFVLGLIFLGKEFGVFTLVGTLSYSGFLLLGDLFFMDRKLIVEDPLVNMIVGSAFLAIGLAVVFNQNASTGGTDILAKIITKYTSIGLGTSVMLADVIVIILAIFTLGIEKAIYGVLSLVFSSMVIDKVLMGFNSLIKMTIISSEIDKINEYVIKELNRGTTIYVARGGYTHREKDILVTIVGRRQYVKIKNYINSIDDNAFVFINNTSEVIGEGFTRETVDEED